MCNIFIVSISLKWYKTRIRYGIYDIKKIYVEDILGLFFSKLRKVLNT